MKKDSIAGYTGNTDAGWSDGDSNNVSDTNTLSVSRGISLSAGSYSASFFNLDEYELSDADKDDLTLEQMQEYGLYNDVFRNYDRNVWIQEAQDRDIEALRKEYCQD